MPPETQPKPATNWMPQTRVIAGGGIGLALANIIAYYFQMPDNIEASMAVLVTVAVTYLWPASAKQTR